MRVLLTANASYSPPKGGSTRSNLIWLADLARRGHACRVVCSTAGPLDDDSSIINGDGVEIFSVRDLTRRTRVLAGHIADFQADWVLVSSEDVSHVLLREAAAKASECLIYLAHTPQWYPFGPASWHPDRQAAEIVRRARAVVAIAKTTAAYIREHGGAEATVIHPPLYGEGPFPRFGSFNRGYLLLVNPCVVKGIGIFLELARRFPQYEFAGLAGWGTTSRDRDAMRELGNVSVLESVPHIDDVLSEARLLLMPSIWFEGFGLIAMEAMLRGLPVIASNAGGLVEAKQGTDYVLPVRMIEKFEPAFDETHMPRPVEIEQDIRPWQAAVERLLGSETAYWTEADRSREVALKFVASLRVSAFEEMLARLEPAGPAEKPATAVPSPAREARTLASLTPAQKALLMKRLRERGKQ